jgi:hypothetical protein
VEVSSLDMRAKRPRSQAGKDRRKSEWMIDVLRAEQVGEWMLIGCVQPQVAVNSAMRGPSSVNDC